MDNCIKRRVALAVTGATLLAGGGIAWSATSAKDERTALLDAVAKRLGVTSERLTDALRGALGDRIDEAVKDGRLTQDQADALKERLKDADGLPGLGPGFGPGFGFGGAGGPGPGGPGRHGFGFAGPGGGIDAAATYLGVEAQDLGDALRDGRSLADVAKDKGKSVDGLVDAIVAAQKKALAEAVEEKRLTDAQRDRLESGLTERAERLVEAKGGERGRLLRRGRGAWSGPPPDAALPAPGDTSGSSDASAGEASPEPGPLV